MKLMMNHRKMKRRIYRLHKRITSYTFATNICCQDVSNIQNKNARFRMINLHNVCTTYFEEIEHTRSNKRQVSRKLVDLKTKFSTTSNDTNLSCRTFVTLFCDKFYKTDILLTTSSVNVSILLIFTPPHSTPFKRTHNSET